MSTENNPKKNRDRRPSIFFPLLLIAAGVYFLLANLNVIPGDFWSTLWKLWPVLFIAGGIDGIIRRESLVTNSLFIVLGSVILLSNFGYLAYSVWDLILYLWPLLLVALGFDLLIGRRSLWLSLVGLVVFMAILAGALWYLRPQALTGTPVATPDISQTLDGATKAAVDLSIGAGQLGIEPLDSQTFLIEGSTPTAQNLSVSQSYRVVNGFGKYALDSEGQTKFFFSPQANNLQWTFNLNQGIPLQLIVDLGAGQASLDLSQLNLSDLKYTIGAGQSEIVLPDTGKLSASISMAIGQITVIVPKGAVVRIDTDSALVIVSTPEGYTKQGDTYTSPGYTTATQQINLKVGGAVGTIEIKER